MDVETVLRRRDNTIMALTMINIVTVLFLVLFRGLLFMTKPMPFISGTGLSFLNLFQLLYKFYMAVWFISVITKHGYGASIMEILQRAFNPISIISNKLGISTRHFSAFSFLFLWIAYSLLSFLIHLFASYGTTIYSFTIIHAFGEGLILFI